MTREQWKNRNNKQQITHIWSKDELTDKELWIQAYCAVATSIGCKEPTTAHNWADKALDYWKTKEQLDELT